MSKCLSVPVPLGPGKPPGLMVHTHAHVPSASRQTAQGAPRRSQARDHLGRGGTGATAPLMGTLLRVFGRLAGSLRALPKASVKAQLLPEKFDSHSQRVADASDLGRAPTPAEPVRNHQRNTFRGAWTHTKSGARFERRRLMRMHHGVRREDSR